MKCPLCGKEVKQVIHMPYDEPWVATSPTEGLSVYGPYSSDKGSYCQWKIADYAWGLHLGNNLILRAGYDGEIPKEAAAKALIKRRCSECDKEAEYENERRYRPDIFFCSEECRNRFWKRDAELRAERGLPPLRDENGNISFPLKEKEEK